MTPKSPVNRISPAVRLALAYFVFSSIWILFSDNLVRIMAHNNPDFILEAQHIKGLFFVIISSILLYLVSGKLYNNIKASLHRQEELLEKYKALNEAAEEGVVDYDFEKDVAVINEQMQRFFDLDSPVVEGFSAPFFLRIHPDDRERVYKNLQDTIASHGTIWQADYQFKFPDKQYRDVRTRGCILRDQATGNPLHFIGTMQDVTEIKHVKAIYYEQQINHKQTLARSIIQAQENERNRWAQELHDNVCQLLTVAKLFLDQLPEDPHGPMVQKSRDMVSKALNDIRLLSTTIKPPEFDFTTLHEALSELVNSLSRFRKYEFYIEMDDDYEVKLNNDQKLMIYRVVQEQFNNIIKYAEAGTIWVEVKVKDHKAYIRIKDDGKGFDQTAREGGLGLRNIRSRLQVYAGDLTIESSPGKGCLLLANFSLS